MVQLIFLLAVCALGYVFILDPAGPGDMSCAHAHQAPCEDLLAPTIRVINHRDRASLLRYCPQPQNIACALRDISYASADCDIHILESAPEHILEHELNHCRGWEHDGDSLEAYLAPWHVNRRMWVARGG